MNDVFQYSPVSGIHGSEVKGFLPLVGIAVGMCFGNQGMYHLRIGVIIRHLFQLLPVIRRDVQVILYDLVKLLFAQSERVKLK